MSANGIEITLEQVASTAATIKSLNAELETRLGDIQREMNALQSSWQSEAANTIRTNFTNSAKRFPEYKKVVDSYATFLEKAVDAYTQTESAINKNANAFL